MGMAIKSELGEEGFEIWDDWSRQADNYERRAARDVWRSIGASGKITIATMFHRARSHGWRDDSIPAPEELAERRRNSQAHPASEEAQISQQRARTEKLAEAIWSIAVPTTPDHPYLSRKQVLPVGCIREIDAQRTASILGYAPTCRGEPLEDRLLTIPVKVRDRLSTLELIDGAGRKAALAGRGTEAGGYWAAQPLPDGTGVGLTLLLGEGVATVLSATQATNHLGIAALSNSNLVNVAEYMRERFPAAQIVVLADLDKASGTTDRHALAAARSVRGSVAVPNFGSRRAPSVTDFNDMAGLFGLEAVAQAITKAFPSLDELPMPGVDVKGPLKKQATVELIRASDLSPEPIDWLWREYLPRGKVTVLAGAPGTGKTTIAMKIAATVSNGARWPDNSKSPRGEVLIWSGEDDSKDTLIPRLALAGADLEHVHFISTVTNSDGRRSFDPARDMAALRAQLPASSTFTFS